MRKHIPHPVSQSRESLAQLHILYGGKEHTAIEESLELARDLREAVYDEETILYVNLLVSSRRFEHLKGKRFDHGARRGRNVFVTHSHTVLMQKLPYLAKAAKDRNAAYVILNGFELAAMTPRHRMEFLSWIKELRFNEINVVIFTRNCPGNYGSLGSLGFMASTIEEVGSYAIEEEKINAVTADDENVEWPDEELKAHERNAYEPATEKETHTLIELTQDIEPAYDVEENTLSSPDSMEEMEPDSPELISSQYRFPPTPPELLARYSFPEFYEAMDNLIGLCEEEQEAYGPAATEATNNDSLVDLEAHVTLRSETGAKMPTEMQYSDNDLLKTNDLALENVSENLAVQEV